MKKLFLVIFLFFISSFVDAQDLIIETNGKKVKVKIFEIRGSIVKYRLFNQPQGPDRVTETDKIYMIVYENGESLEFNQGNDVKLKFRHNPLTPSYFKSGLFFDGAMGIANIGYLIPDFQKDPFLNSNKIDRNYFSLDARFGHRWYVGKREKWHPGIQVNWLRMGMYIEPNDHQPYVYSDKTLSPLNIGMANGFQLSKKVGLELNFTTGFTLTLERENSILGKYFTLSPEVKLRINKFALGIDYQNLESFKKGIINPNHWNILSISFGFKF